MPSFQWAILCQQVITDTQTNLVSYINAIERIGSTEFPVTLPTLAVGTLWRRDTPEDEIVMRVSVRDDEDNVIEQTDEQRRSFGDYQRFRFNLSIRGLRIEEPGTIWFDVECKADGEWTTATSIPMIIDRESKEENAGGNGETEPAKEGKDLADD